MLPPRIAGSAALGTRAECCAYPQVLTPALPPHVRLQLLGVALTVVAGLVKTHRQDLIDKAHISEEDINAVMPADDVNVAIAGGCLLMVVALVGCCGARKYEDGCGKALLCVYSLFMFVVIVLEVVAFAAVIVLTGTLDDFSSDVTKGVNTTKLNQKINNFVNDARCACCPKSYTGSSCTDPDAGNQAGSDACNLLSDIINEDNCESNKAFTKPVVDWINARLRAVGIFSLVVAIIQLCTLCASCCLLCRGKDKKKDQFQPAGPGNYQNPQPIGSGAAQPGQAVTYA